MFGAERLLGLQHVSVNEERPNQPDREYDYNEFTLGWSPTGSALTAPRFGFDAFLNNGLSLGVSGGYFSFDDNDRDDDRSGVLFAPRVGYLWDFTDSIGFWLRGGLGYYSFGREYHLSGMALGGEGAFVFAPSSNFAFMVGPFFDATVFGEQEHQAGDTDEHYRVFGVSGGIMGWVDD